MESVIKLAIQYFGEIGQPQRTNFIARRLSYHGNSLGTLSLAHHPARRGPYEPFLDHQNFHHVSPAYAKRFQKLGETEEQYVERLRQELEDKFIALGPNTVIGCECSSDCFRASWQWKYSRCRDRCRNNDGCRPCSEGVFQSYEICL